MKTLIAIISARHRADWRNAIRRTWGPQVPRDKGVDAFFFVGRGAAILDGDNVIELDCNDDYQSIPEKVRAIAKWALEHGYRFMLKCDDDVVLRPSDFMSSGFEQHTYSGRANRHPQPYIVPFGFCYVLNHDCMKIVAESELPIHHIEPFDDERWVADILWARGIQLTDVRRYVLCHYVNYDQAPQNAFAFCVHLPDPQEVKLIEFQKLFAKYGEGEGKAQSLAWQRGQELVNRRRYTDPNCLIQNWWDSH